MLLKDHRDVVMLELEDLLHTALGKMANSVLTTRNPNPAQEELFKEYNFAERISVPASGDDGAKRAFALIKDVPISILEQHLASKSKPRKTTPADLELARAIEDLKPYAISKDTTLPEAWELKKDVEKRGASKS
jgi:hypothetical protein